MKNTPIRLTVMALISCVFLFYPLTSANANCLIEEILKKENSCLKGDVNDDGEVDYDDLNAIREILSGYAPDDYNPADVNCDGQVTSDDVNYLKYFLWGYGPPPCETTLQHCTSSPCYIRINGQLVKLTAEPGFWWNESVTWKAQAYKVGSYSSTKMAVMDLTVNYGDPDIPFSLGYERKKALLGLPDIPYKTVEGSMPAVHAEDGTPKRLDRETMFMGIYTLITATGDPASVIHSPVTHNDPVYIPQLLLSDALNSCFSSHDFCYQRGGSEQNRQDCDHELLACLDLAGLAEGSLWCGDWKYRKGYAETFYRIFNAGGFRYHDEDWTCHFETKGHDLDSLLNAATLLNDCGACAGQDTCDVSCAVQLGDETLEYPCVKILK